MWKIILPILLLTGCASSKNYSQISSNNHPLMSIAVDCRHGARMVNDLEYIIANPKFVNPYWQPVFATVAGNQSPEQRSSSAKSVLWTIRTQCQGF